VSCAKTAQPTEMQFRVLSRVGSGKIYDMVCRGNWTNGGYANSRIANSRGLDP